MKPQPKAPAKSAKAAAGKTPAKAAPKVAAKKAPAKKVPPVKKASTPKAAPAKAPARTVAKAPAKPKTPAKAPTARKAAAAPAARKAAAPAQKPTATPRKPAPAPARASARPTPVAPAPTPAMPPRPAPAQVQATPARATRPSARLAQITVPSMAQSVASTAAKASYIQTPSSSVLTPPPLVNVKKDPKLANNWKSKSAEELTDAEVLAMPDSEYMNDKQMAFFRWKLVQLKQDILNNAGETTEHLREDTVIVPDPADRATIEEEHALELRTRDRERKLLKKIEQSIARIDAGDYGYCDETGEPIGVGRLLARPTATLSLEAQQRRELKQKMFGD
ncbi:RNA polymerase-binding protein DksA [Ramlibacter tataouinensis]|uniref:RNA polymerase-binding protein DksA n=1 Tax=Ramlibacter tataouinensis TaxID=94132 RepID=UPI0022F3B0EF|nr:RNA polymerase-binding protein DksA [Ramlibacter tataouinensis]WBY00764.1 RNA polymerase-binding protein DksA [Ramlibacter tataouinensis]